MNLLTLFRRNPKPILPNWHAIALEQETAINAQNRIIALQDAQKENLKGQMRNLEGQLDVLKTELAERQGDANDRVHDLLNAAGVSDLDEVSGYIGLEAHVRRAVERLNAFQGPKCLDQECPDYDGEHPYHQSLQVKAHETGQAKMRQKLDSAQCDKEAFQAAHLRANKAEADLAACHEAHVNTERDLAHCRSEANALQVQLNDRLAESLTLQRERDHFMGLNESAREELATMSKQLERATGRLAQVEAEWEEKADESSLEIDAEFPTRSGNHERFLRALELVNHRHDKYSLVALVNWLLARAEKAEALVKDSVQG